MSNSGNEPTADGTAPSIGDERECPDCGGRQVVTAVGRKSGRDFIKTGEDWICTDSWCDRQDMITESVQR